jgi:glycerol-3-phosphate dehydrogenase
MRVNALAGIGHLTHDVRHFSKGVHVVTRQILPNAAVALRTRRQTAAILTRGGRHVFVIPWRGRSLIGTTSTPFEGTLDEVAPSGRDVEDLLADVNAAMPAARLTSRDVCYSFAGLYPLTDSVARPEVYQGTGAYQIVDHARDVDGLVTVLGAKYTTARQVAERATDLALRKLGLAARPCRTRVVRLVGGEIDDMPAWTRQMIAAHPDVPASSIGHLVRSYGTELEAVVDTTLEGRSLCAPLAADRDNLEAEVVFAARHEMAVHLEDVLFRRTGLATIGHPGHAGIRRAAVLMGSVLGWTPAERERQIAAVEARLAAHFALPPDAPDVVANVATGHRA